MVKIPSEARRLHKLGFAIHWLAPHSKRPINEGWTKGPRLSLDELERTYRPGYNVGARLGDASVIDGKFLGVVDLDIKSEDPAHREDALNTLYTLFPQVQDGPYLLSGRGNGSAHYYVLLDEVVKGDETKAKSSDEIRVKMPSVAPSRKERETLSISELNAGIRLRPAWEISLLSHGRQVVLVDSIHPDTKNPYVWGKAINGSGKDIPLLPLENTPVGVKKAPKADKNAPHRGQFQFVAVELQKTGLKPHQIRAIVSGDGVKDRSAEIYGLCMALLQHKASDEQIVSIFTDKDYYLGNCAYEHANTPDRQRAAQWVAKYCLAKAKEKVNEVLFDIEEIIGDGEKPARLTKGTLPKGFTGEPWEADLEFKSGGSKDAPLILKSTYLNLRIILANKCDCQAFLHYDLFSMNMYYTCDTPWGRKKGDKRSPGEEDALLVRSWFASTYGFAPSKTEIDNILNTVGYENQFHPLKDYLNGLKWDGVERVAGALKTYLGAVMPEPYLSDVSKKFFIGAVKRVFEPGCKFDYALVLEGPQGKGKSTFVDILAGQWFLDGLPNLADKDAAVNIQGIWLCELGEMAATYKTMVEATKAFISRRIDRFRPPFAPRRGDFPRTCVFVGSTNASAYLIDHTGNRRWWPVHMRQLKKVELIRDRDQLWAEAMFLYQFCEEELTLEKDSLSERQANEIQESRRVEDEGDLIAEVLFAWFKENPKVYSEGVTINELLKGPLLTTVGVKSMNRVASFLTKTGFRKMHTKHGNKWVCKLGEPQGKRYSP